MKAHRRHDISDSVWHKIESHLPGKLGSRGGIAKDNRSFINGVLWILRTGAPWRHLPYDYGGWKNTHRRFCRWRDKGIWEHLLEVLIFEADFEWLMIDSTFVKAHKAAACARVENQMISRTKGCSIPRYIWPWIRMVCRAESLLQKVPEMTALKLIS